MDNFINKSPEQIINETKFPPEAVAKVGFEYGYLTYKNFKCRSVIKDGKATGEYHIAPIGMETGILARLLSSTLDDSIVDIIDKELNLEYPISLTIESTMINESVDDLFNQIDKQIGG